MRANLGLTRGLIMAEAVQMALGAKLGRQQAHGLVERTSRRAVAEGRELGAVLAEDGTVTAALAPGELERLLDPLHLSRRGGRFVDRALAAARDSRGEA